MEDNVMHISPENIEIVDVSEYCEDLTEYFGDMPEVARPLMKGAKEAFSKIENMLYSAPAFINLVKASVPEQAFQAILTDDQKAKIASGALKLINAISGVLLSASDHLCDVLLELCLIGRLIAKEHVDRLNYHIL